MRTTERVSAELERLVEIDRDKFYFLAKREFCIGPNGRDDPGRKIARLTSLTYRRRQGLLLITALKSELLAGRVQVVGCNRGARKHRILLKLELAILFTPGELYTNNNHPLDIIVARGRPVIERASYICVRRLLSKHICDYARVRLCRSVVDTMNESRSDLCMYVYTWAYALHSHRLMRNAA